MRRLRRILVTDSPTAPGVAADVVIWLGRSELPDSLDCGRLVVQPSSLRAAAVYEAVRGMSESLGALIGCFAPPGRDLSVAQLELLAEQIAAAPALWREHVRHYPRLFAGALAHGPLRARLSRPRPGLADLPRRGRGGLKGLYVPIGTMSGRLLL